MSAVSFDPIAHEYRANGRKVPSVTQVLRAEGLYGSYQFSESHHKFRGHAVHKSCALLDFGERPVVSGPVHLQQVVDDINNGYIPAFANWKARARWQGRVWEVSLVDPVRGVGGTLDTAGELDGRFGLGDIKSGTLPEMVCVQIAAYLDLLQNGIPTDSSHTGLDWLTDLVRRGTQPVRFAVRLEKSGKDTMYTQTSKGEAYDLPKWTVLWRSILNAHNAKSQYGLLDKNSDR